MLKMYDITTKYTHTHTSVTNSPRAVMLGGHMGEIVQRQQQSGGNVQRFLRGDFLRRG